MIKKITQNEKEQRQRELREFSGQNSGFSSLGIKASENRLKLTHVTDLQDPNYKTSTFTTVGPNSSSLLHRANKPPLIPHYIEKEEAKKFDQSDAEIMDSQFLSSNSSMEDEISDIDEHSGLKKLEKHLGSYDDQYHHPTVEDVTRDKIQLVTEISTYQDDEIADSVSHSIPITHTSIRSRMIGNYKSRTEDHEKLNASQINEGVEYVNGGRAVLKR